MRFTPPRSSHHPLPRLARRLGGEIARKKRSTVMDNENLSILGSKVFHIFNRGNGRRDIFIEEENYEFFVLKMNRQLAAVGHLLAYCLMPNHFHFLLIPKHDLRSEYELDGEVHDAMPTKELGEAMKRLQMGYTKSVNQFYNLAGSVFQQHAKSNHHTGSIREGMNYIHFNPSKAGLVGDPSEWAFSSYNEYSGIIPDSECFCNVDLGRKLLDQ